MGLRETESAAQSQSDDHTMQSGGKSPTAQDVIKSANARSMKRHDSTGDLYADVGVLPDSGGACLDKDGIHDEGYIVKKKTPYGVNAFFNSLPPGTNIQDQELADIREQPLKIYKGGLSYPDDGGF